MTKKTKKQLNKILKSRTALVVGIVSILLLVGVVVQAKISFLDKVAQIAGQVLGEKLYGDVDISGEEIQFGALTSPDITSRWMRHNGLMTYVENASFKDMTTTIVSFVNPFGASATSTVDLAKLTITGGATTTFDIICGASTDASADPSYNLIDSDDIATSSIGVIENNISSSYTNGYGGGSVAKIMLTPETPYFVCKARTKAAIYDGAFTEPTNTFDGTYKVRITKDQ
jgi:hypothetical protein